MILELFVTSNESLKPQHTGLVEVMTYHDLATLNSLRKIITLYDCRHILRRHVPLPARSKECPCHDLVTLISL